MRGEARAGTSIHVPAPSPKLPGSITRGSHQPLPGIREETKTGRERGHCGAKLKVIRATSRGPGHQGRDHRPGSFSKHPAGPSSLFQGSQCLLCRRLISHMAQSTPGKVQRASLSQWKASQPRRCHRGGSWQRHHGTELERLYLAAMGAQGRLQIILGLQVLLIS